MDQTSLDKAAELINDIIYNSNINLIDKYELLLNLNYFLNNYEQETKSKVTQKTLAKVNKPFKAPNSHVDARNGRK